MLIIENKVLGIFKTADIWFSDSPENTQEFDALTYRQCKNKSDLPGFERSEYSTLILDLEEEVDDIWKGITSKSCKYNINRAKREDVSVEISQDYEGFIERYNKFAKDKGIELSGFSIEEMKRFGALFVAKYDNKIVSSHLYLEDDKYIRSLLACSDRFSDISKIAGYANRLIIWEAIQYAKNKGIKTFDFGGYYTGKKPDSEKEKINKFKKEFGGKLVTQYNYKRVDSPVYKLLKAGYRVISSLRR